MRESVSFMKDALRRLATQQTRHGVPVHHRTDRADRVCRARVLPVHLHTTGHLRQSTYAPVVLPRRNKPRSQGRDMCSPHHGHRLTGPRLCQPRDLRHAHLAARRLRVGHSIVVIIGILYGAISGYFGGRVDLIMMRIVDIIYALPDVLIVILLSVAIKDIVSASKMRLIIQMGAGMVSIFIVFGLLYWVGMARQVRGQILSIKEQEYVLASKSIGASPSRIIRKHMIPKLRVGHHHHRRHADSLRHLHRELSLVPGAGRIHPDAFAGFAGTDARSGLDVLSVPIGLPGACPSS